MVELIFNAGAAKEITMTQRHRNLLSDIPFEEDKNGCWLCSLRSADGGYAIIRRNGVEWRAHRLSFTRCKGPIPAGMNVLHRCDTPRCIRPSHLWAGTQRENVEDMDRKGRRSAASRADHGHAVLSEKDVADIRASDSMGIELAARYNVSASTISKVRTGRTWRR